MAGIRLASVIFAVLDARVALVSLLLLIMAAAAPIVLGWLALLPSEREPFALAGEASGSGGGIAGHLPLRQALSGEASRAARP